MLPNVVGMSQYADGGLMTTKPYTSGGAYINKMSDLCGPCAYRPTARTGDHACPYTRVTGPSSTATAPAWPPTTVRPAPSKASTDSKTCPNSSTTPHDAVTRLRDRS